MICCFFKFLHFKAAYHISEPTFEPFVSCLLSSLNTLTTNIARFSTTGVEVSGEVTAFTFGLLKTGDKKPAVRKESKTLKVVIYLLCQTSAKTV